MQSHYYCKRLPIRANASTSGYNPQQVASLYSFPPLVNSANVQGIALIELGGGYSQSDINTYFKAISLPIPSVTFISVQGAENAPDGPNGAQGEVMLDICVAGGVTGGKVPIYVVIAPNTDAGFAAAINWAASSPNVSTISISWGGPEDQWDAGGIVLMNSALELAQKNGKTVTVASGDNGSTDGETGNHVDFPASSPYVLGCGGTNLQSNSETVWNSGSQGGAGGGGVSTLFPVPAFQPTTWISGKGRGVPDVAGDADPASGWRVMVDGQMSVFGGTSAVAPMWAGLICLLNQNLGTNLGFCNDKLYGLIGDFNDVTVGNNGTFVAKTGYDLCTGLGTPNGIKLLNSLKDVVINPPVPTPTPTPVPIPSPTYPTFTTVNPHAAKSSLCLTLNAPLPAGKYKILPQ